MPATRYPLLVTLLRRYFYSGWAFLIPYLAAYLLYYITGWPVNPAEAAGERVSSSPLTPLTPDTSHSLIPSLLHLYWALHALHLVLAALALRSWWQERPKNSESRPLQPQLPDINWRLDALLRIAPWAILALILYIPGAYLEWPSDPWQHLRRINEWHVNEIITDHSQWKKFSYFLPYSLTAYMPEHVQMSWIALYYSSLGLLLCWQYFLLALEVRLNWRWAMAFVVLSLLSMGNVGFAYIRYYGLSSTIIGQICSLVVVRLCIRSATQTHTTRQHWLTGASICALFGMMLLTHIQSLAIASLGLLSVVGWKLTSGGVRARWAAVLFAAISVGIGFTIDLPSVIARTPNAGDWFTEWNGFALFTTGPAMVHSLQIFGWFGILNILAGIALLSKHHPTGWLVVGPLILLSLPVFALPIAAAVVSRPPTELFLFQRTLFCVPPGLAMVCALAAWRPNPSFPRPGFICLLSLLTAFVVLTPEAPIYNRLWNLLSVVPSSLTSIDFDALEQRLPFTGDRTQNIAARGLAIPLNTFRPSTFPYQERYIGEPVSFTLTPVLAKLGSIDTAHEQREEIRIFIAEQSIQPYQYSITGAAIRHWNSHQRSIDLAGQAELMNAAQAAAAPIIQVRTTSGPTKP